MLPKQFSELDDLVGEWVFPEEGQRSFKRSECSLEELQIFRGRLDARVEECCAYLDKFPLGELSDENRRLLHLIQMYLEVALALDLYGQPELPVAFPRGRFQMNTLPRYEFGEVRS